MLRRFVGLSLLATPLVLSACGRTLSVEPRLVAVQNVLAATGYSQSGAISEFSLDRGGEARFAVDLEAGECRTFVAIGAASVRNVDIVISDDRGAERAHDESFGRNAAVEICASATTHADVLVRVTAGRGDITLSSYSGSGSGRSTRGGGRPSSQQAACEAAPRIAPGEIVSGDTQQGANFGQGTCVRGAAPELYYRLDVEQRSAVQVWLESAYDGALYIVSRCGDRRAELACNDDDGDTMHSRIVTALEPGTYYIVVDGYGDQAGPFDLRVELAPMRPIAEVCAEAPRLSLGTTQRGSTTESVDQFQATCAGGARSPDQVYSLALDERSRVRVLQRTDSGFDGALHMRTSCADAATEVACNDDYAGTAQSVITGVFDGGTYYVVADGYSSASRTGAGSFSLDVTTAPAEGEAGSPADACENAGTIAEGQTTIDTIRARDDFRGSCGGQGGADVVYRLRVTGRRQLSVIVSESQFRGAVYVRRACATESAELACAAIEFSGTSNEASRLEATLDAGEYFLVFDGVDPQSFGAAKVAIGLLDTEALTREAARSPQLRDGQSVSGTTAGRPDSVNASCGGGARSPDAVYRFRITRRSFVELDLTTPGHDGLLHVRRDAASISSELACNDDLEPGNTTRSRIAMNFEPGTYYVYVDGFGADSSGAFTLRYATSAPRADLPPPTHPGVRGIPVPPGGPSIPMKARRER